MVKDASESFDQIWDTNQKILLCKAFALLFKVKIMKIILFWSQEIFQQKAWLHIKSYFLCNQINKKRITQVYNIGHISIDVTSSSILTLSFNTSWEVSFFRLESLFIKARIMPSPKSILILRIQRSQAADQSRFMLLLNASSIDRLNETSMLYIHGNFCLWFFPQIPQCISSSTFHASFTSSFRSHCRRWYCLII